MLRWIRAIVSYLTFKRKMKFQPQGKKNSQGNYEKQRLKTVAAIQMKFETFRNVKDFYEKILFIVREAKDSEAQMVCFPAGMNLLLQPVAESRVSQIQRQRIAETVSKIFSDIAATEEVYLSEAEIVGNTVIKKIWNPRGKRIEGRIFSIDQKRVAFLEEQADDVHLILNPMVSTVWFNDYESFSHAWLRSQQNSAYSVESYMVGGSFSGKSGIYGPIEVTDSRNGIIASANSELFQDVVVADLDFEAVERLKKNQPKGYERLFPADNNGKRTNQQS